MIQIPKDLTDTFFKNKYPISSGSKEWHDIKVDFELEDDAIMGTVSKLDTNSRLEIDKIKGFKSELEKFQIRINNYIPKDDLENNEKEIIKNKVDAGLSIYNQILQN